jgi:phosphatidylserine synthase
MLDTAARSALAGPLDRIAAALDRRWVSPDRLTIGGLVLGLLGAAAAAGQLWEVALALWLASRLADGLDGPLARRRRQAGAEQSEADGFLDITADFTVYGAFVVGVGLGWGGSLVPFLVVLLAYYVNGAAFLAFSSIAERTSRRLDDGRSLSFLGGLAEGTETIAVTSLWCLLPGAAGSIAWVWAAVVGLSAGQRIVAGYLTLRAPVR